MALTPGRTGGVAFHIRCLSFALLGQHLDLGSVVEPALTGDDDPLIASDTAGDLDLFAFLETQGDLALLGYVVVDDGTVTWRRLEYDIAKTVDAMEAIAQLDAALAARLKEGI